ncbi:MAG TPA: MBL fold metallo-hydrolase, partial [Pyrinomonadaceae bacterium]
MNQKLANLRAYTRFARQHAGRFIAQRREEAHTPIALPAHRPDPSGWSDDSLTVAWLGHATVLINFYGTWLLTDPALRSHVGVRFAGTTFGPRRIVMPALSVRELPRLDAVLISHAHMDHCDLGTLRSLPRRTRAVVQCGNRDLVRRFHPVDELEWGQRTEVGGVSIE